MVQQIFLRSSLSPVIRLFVQESEIIVFVLPEGVANSSHIASLIEISFAPPTRVINVDDLQFSIKVEGRRSLLAIADPCSFDPAERNVRLTAGGRRIDVRH